MRWRTPPSASSPGTEREHNVTHFAEYGTGGHFAALQMPELLAGDIRTFFTSVR
jgi:hypothetical protein